MEEDYVDGGTTKASDNCDEDVRHMVEYDESSYPANAESESEEEKLLNEKHSAEATLQNSPGHWEEGSREGLEGSRLALSDDFLCAVCAEVFVEPSTLHCGHSFCQLCLAALWKSNRNKPPSQLYCPVCRQPWVNFPGVNIQLRNIVEKSHGQLVDSRRGHFSEMDRATLINFKKAMDGDWKKERRQTRQQQLRPVVWILLLAVLFCGLVIIIAAILLSVLALSGDSSEYVQNPVSEWNNDDVMAWLEGLGDWATRNISHIFLKEKITGAQLKLIDISALRSLGVHLDYFRMQSLLLAIEQLKQRDYIYPRNFNEYMAMHRRKTVLIGIMYKLWPRFTFLYIYLFEYQDVFLPVWQYSAAVYMEGADSLLQPNKQQIFVFCIEVLLVPHYVVGLFAWHWFNLHPWLCTAIMIHCVWATQNEAKKVISYLFTLTLINWKLKFSQTLRVFWKSMLKFVLVMSGGIVVWPIVPYFVCDGLFYLVVWNTVYTHVLVMPWKLFAARRRRLHAHPPLLQQP